MLEETANDSGGIPGIVAEEMTGYPSKLPSVCEVGFRIGFHVWGELQMGMIKEFKTFALRGNVVDMAVGIIIGAAFGKIVTSLVNDVVMPPIGLLLADVDFSQLTVVLREKTADAEAVTINYGAFINTVLHFVIVAFVIFLVVRQVNRMRRDETAKPETTKGCPYCMSVIDIKASRCPNCTSQLEANASTP